MKLIRKDYSCNETYENRIGTIIHKEIREYFEIDNLSRILPISAPIQSLKDNKKYYILRQEYNSEISWSLCLYTTRYRTIIYLKELETLEKLYKLYIRNKKLKALKNID